MRLRALLVAALSLVPAGCERGGGSAAVLARVNGAEISLAGAAGASGAALREALEKVIDRELLVQRALEERLDRDPQVRAALEAARREVLARAWIDRLARGAAGEVTRERVQAFYAENPALFAERRIYRLRELVVSAPPELLDMLRAEAARAASLDELAAWLRVRGARFSFVSLAQPAEELPLAWLPRLARMTGGELAVFTRPAYAGAPAGISVVRLEQAEDAPLDEARAAPLIERFLAGRRRLELAAAELRRLREAARIEYVTDKR
ncbi:MAG TPA: EpsD family peptidyl-prolyl cis-trans isomerase [Burkholderiales bacterium]